MTDTTPSTPPTVAITGASGFLGSALVRSFEQDGWRVLALTRGRATSAGQVHWDPDAGAIDAAVLEGVSAVVHLAGESIDGRWTEEKKRAIRESRLRGTSLLARTLASLSSPPDVLVSGSAVGFYGADRGDERLTESSAPGEDFLGELGVAWEAAAAPAVEAGIRVVHPRLGVVLDPEGGALKRMLPPFRLGAGGRMGSGRQWMAWISRPDAIRALRFLVDRPALSGGVNVVAPEPVLNSEFTGALGDALGRPALMAVPAVALRLAFGEMADGTILASQRVLPHRLLEAGFQFEHPRIDVALSALLARSG